MGRAKTGAEQEEQRAQWIARLSRFEKDGRTVAAFCAGEGVSSWSFYTWRKKLVGAASGAERAKRGLVAAATPAAGADGFIDAGVARMVGERHQAGLSAAGVEVQIELGGGVLLRLVRR